MTGNKAQETPIPTNAVPADEGALTWRAVPSDAEPRKRWVVLVIALVAFGAGVSLFENLLLGLLGFAIIVGSTAEYWLGTAYRVDAKGASSRCGLSYTVMEWGQVRRAIETADGLKLSPLAQPGRMDAFRGLNLRFAEGNREAVLEAVRRSLPEDVRILEG